MPGTCPPALRPGDLGDPDRRVHLVAVLDVRARPPDGLELLTPYELSVHDEGRVDERVERSAGVLTEKRRIGPLVAHADHLPRVRRHARLVGEGHGTSGLEHGRHPLDHLRLEQVVRVEEVDVAPRARLAPGGTRSPRPRGARERHPAQSDGPIEARQDTIQSLGVGATRVMVHDNELARLHRGLGGDAVKAGLEVREVGAANRHHDADERAGQGPPT